MKAFDRMAANIRRNRLLKDPRKGILLGVCAGVARWLGLETWVVRAVMVLALLLFTGPAIIVYLLAALILNKRPSDRLEDFHDRYGIHRHPHGHGRYGRHG